MQNLTVNKQIPPPAFSLQSGTYDRTEFLDLSKTQNEAEIYYSLDGKYPNRKFYEEIAIRKSCTVKAITVIGDKCSEMAEHTFQLNKPAPVKGSVMVIGGAEHCKELHQKFVELAGGINSTKIVFIPASSSEPYASGIDRETRFHDLTGLNIDPEKVPLVNGKRDFSSLKDESNFWILPLAYKDDEFKTDHSQNDPSTPLSDESSFPTLDEHDWLNNGHDKKIAEKLRDGGYNAVFLTGGNQARYIECLKYDDGSDSPVLAMIREIYEERGGVIAGTSAGGAVLSHIMMMGGGSYGAATQGVVQEDVDVMHYEDEYTPFNKLTDTRIWLGHGFGILDRTFITDTHFVIRGRIGRLVTACLHRKVTTGKNKIGLGADEDTAIVIRPDGTGEVCGALDALLVDVSKAVITHGKPAEGNYSAKNIILHYLENGDQFTYSLETGEVKVTSISKTKTKIMQPQYSIGHNFFFELDIFGKYKVRRCMTEYLADNTATESIGFEMIDNLEDSYDTIMFKDVDKAGSTFFKFRKTENTEAYKGTIQYNWWGKGDHNYPHLLQVTENDRYSVTNVLVDISPVSFRNFPDITESEHMPLKSEILKEGGSEDEWYDLFDERKKYKFGMILSPAENNLIEVRTFFFDYAYNDYDGDGYYSPPRLKPEGHKGGYKDYDVAEMDKAQGAKVFLNGETIGATDLFGKATISLKPGKNTVKTSFTGCNEYIAEYAFDGPLNEAVIIFEK
ncbi:MAG: chitobiase/beta-hexosaminidase C-terminal domain-containing protein [Bacteroidia bacterium]|nr:chitobiase/beta-hexosaminidase C-terminal domain-containing protein [Bacteroidia bacterium]